MLDPRGPRFAAALTSAVLAVVLVTRSEWLLGAQAVVLALGTANRSPYAVVFRRVVRPHLAPPDDLEDARPVRFAQAVGLAFTLAGLGALVAGSAVLAAVFVGAALVAALLNAVFGFCLGCEIYLLARTSSLPLFRSSASPTSASPTSASLTSASLTSASLTSASLTSEEIRA